MLCVYEIIGYKGPEQIFHSPLPTYYDYPGPCLYMHFTCDESSHCIWKEWLIYVSECCALMGSLNISALDDFFTAPVA